jgi:hypothetical protein
LTLELAAAAGSDHAWEFLATAAGRTRDEMPPMLIALCPPCGLVRSVELSEAEMRIDLTGVCRPLGRKPPARVPPAE